jgi:hypothetical protein
MSLSLSELTQRALIHQEITPMQLTYRGINYTPLTEAEAPKTVQLLYRGVTFNHALNQVAPKRQAICESENPVQLLYRGITYTCAPAPVRPYQKPRAINWRYQLSLKG